MQFSKNFEKQMCGARSGAASSGRLRSGTQWLRSARPAPWRRRHEQHRGRKSAANAALTNAWKKFASPVRDRLDVYRSGAGQSGEQQKLQLPHACLRA